MKALLVALTVTYCALLGCDTAFGFTPDANTRVVMFSGHVVHFTPDEPNRHDTPMVTHSDNGRVIETYLEMRRPKSFDRLIFDKNIILLFQVVKQPKS